MSTPASLSKSRNEIAQHWQTLLAGTIGCAFCMATLAAVSLGSFVKPLEEAMGWSRTEVQGALIFGQGFGSLGILLTGRFLERFSTKAIASISLLANAIAFAAASQVDSLALFYLCYAVAAFVGAGAGFITWSRAITQTFETKRGFALAIALSGTGLASIFVPPVLAAVISIYGWQAGFLVLAGIQGLIALPAILICMRRNDRNASRKEPSSNADHVSWSEILHQRSFWIIMISVFCVYAGVTGMLPNFIPLLTNSGFTPQSAAAAQGAAGIGLLVGRLTLGWLIDRFWAPAVGAIYIIPAAIGSLILANDPSFEMAVVAIALFGVASGAELDLMAYLLSRYFREAAFPRAYSILYIPLAVAGATAPIALSYLTDITGSFDASLYLCALLFPLGGAVLLLLGPYPTVLDNPVRKGDL